MKIIESTSVFSNKSTPFSSIALSTALASAGVTGFTAATKLATIAQTAFNVVAKANPYVLLASVLLGVAAAVGTYMVGTRELTAEQKKQIEAAEAAAAEGDKPAAEGDKKEGEDKPAEEKK